MDNDLKVLLKVNDRIIAEDIQQILEEADIYSMLESDNPASSVLNMYTGSLAIENVSLVINQNDYQNAFEIISNSSYHELLVK